MSKYAAFISYRHGDIDEKVAIRIHREIERYRLPARIAREKGIRTLGKVFRDAEELRAASDLSEIIKEAVEESEWLIVLCTKRYKESVWCMEEIQHFIEVKDREHIIVVLIEGEPYESFPDILTEVEQNGEMVHIEPLAVDVRADSEKEILKNVTKEKFRFIAQMLDIDFDDLRQRQRERKRRQTLTVAGIIIVSLGIFSAIVMRKNIQLGAAYTALDDSMQQTLKGQSYYLSEYANEAYKDGDRSTAALLALEALPKDLSNPERPFVEGVLQSLTQALGIYDYSTGYQTDKVYKLDDEAYDTKSQISFDKKVILIERYMYTAGNMLNRKVYVYGLEDKKLVCSYNLSDMGKSYYSDFTRSTWLMNDSRTLVYLGEDGLKAVDIYTGDEKFSGSRGDVLVVSKKEDVIGVTDYSKGYLYFYNAQGENTLRCEIGTDNKYTFCNISPDSSIAVLSVMASSAQGILFIDTQDGKSTFVSQSGECSNIFFINNTKLCFIRQDTRADLKHIVVYDMVSSAENYLCDANWAIRDVYATDNDTCLYYHGKKLYEVDIESGKVKWSHTFSSNILSFKVENGISGITCSDGKSYFYDVNSKQMINSMEGNGQGYYMLTINSEYACMRDYWGQNIRVYRKKKHDDEKVVSKDISSLIGTNPEKWYTCASEGSRFMLGYTKNGRSGIRIFSGKDLAEISGSTLPNLGYSEFDNLSISLENKDYIGIQDYSYGESIHYDTDNFEKRFEFGEDSYYYYSEDYGTIFLSKNHKIYQYDAVSGKEKEQFSIPVGYDRGVKIGNTKIFGNSTQILIDKDGKGQLIKDAKIYTFNEKRKLIVYRNCDEDKWFVYSLEQQKVVCKGDAGVYALTSFFGNNRYIFNDYSEVYDMDTWKKSLDLSKISNSVYGVHTEDNLPYFVVWYQNGDSVSGGKASGTNMAYLYSKENTGEIVGIVPNYVATAEDGGVIVFDGDHTLRKIPLYSVNSIVERARKYVGNLQFTNEQIETYHLYSK